MELIMANLDVVIWCVLAVFFGVLEMVTVATVSIWFVGGCIVAIGAALVGAPIWLEVILAIAVSGALMGVCRKMIIGKGPSKALPTKVTDGMEGKMGVVTTTIEPGSKGQVMVDGIEWTAMAMNDEDRLTEKTRVVVCRQNGCCCYVDKYDLN